jgi:predicted component of type VI protein secretion system
MAKLVILNQGMTGRTFELNIERTTVGRVEDNTFQIADASVSSHHAEIFLRGPDIVVRDIGSTNGTFINNDKLAEATDTVLQPGQTLRFGQVELKIDDGRAPATAAAAPAPAPAKKSVDSTMIMPRGVSRNELESGGARPAGFDANTQFSKKKKGGNKFFLIGGIVLGVIIVCLVLYLIMQAGGTRH